MQLSLESITCTDKKATWPIPSTNGVEASPVVEMDWGKPSLLKTNVEVPTLDTKGIQSLLEKIEQQNCTSAIMRIVPPFSDKYSTQKEVLPLYFEVYDKANEHKSLEELIQLGNKIDLNVTKELKSKIEESTGDQRQSEEWYKQRKGRITASIFKRVCNTNILKPSISLVKSICYPLKTVFRSKATLGHKI